GMPSRPATARASCRSSRAQQRPKDGPSPPVWSWSCMEIPTTSWPCSWRRAAATEESTPPDMAATTRTGRLRLLHVRDDEHQDVAADPQLHVVAQDLLLDALQVDEGPVRGAQVAQDGVVPAHLQHGVLARGLGDVQVDVGAGAAHGRARLGDL